MVLITGTRNENINQTQSAKNVGIKQTRFNAIIVQN